MISISYKARRYTKVISFAILWFDKGLYFDTEAVSFSVVLVPLRRISFSRDARLYDAGNVLRFSESGGLNHIVLLEVICRVIFDIQAVL